MISIKRELVYNKDFQEALQDVMNKKLKMDDAAYLAKIYFHVKNLSYNIKTSFYLQIITWGGSVLGENKKPPYYEFENQTEQQEFESFLNPYLNSDEEITLFNPIEIQILENDYNNLLQNTVINLTGIVSFNVVTDFSL